MREIYVLLVDEEIAGELLEEADFVGPVMGVSLRKAIINSRDPRLSLISDRQSQSRGLTHKPLVIGGHVRRYYSPKELDSAELFLVQITAEVMDSGEDYGTVYERATACPVCGAGEKQVSDLMLDLRKVPKSADTATTLRHEWLVSQRLAEILLDEEASGFELQKIHHKVRHDDDPIDPRQYPSGRELLRRAEEAGHPYPAGTHWVWLNRPEQADLVNQMRDEYLKEAKEKDVRRTREPQPAWYQLVPTSTVDVHPQTKFGINPFNDDPEGEFRCPLGHARGLNIISEAFVSRESWDGSDFAVSADWVGAPPTPLVPRARFHRLLFISPRLWRLLRENNIRGWKAEIAHLV